MTTRTNPDSFYLPKPNLNLYKNLFPYSAAMIYNKLDWHIKQAVSIIFQISLPQEAYK